MIFKTIDDSVDKTRKTLALFNKDWNTYKTNWQKGFSQNGILGGLKSIFQSNNTSVISKEQIQILRNWNNAVKHGCTNQETFNRIIANADDNTKMYFAGLNKGKGSIEGLTQATNASTASLKTNAVAMKGLAVAGNILASIGLTLVISKALSFINEMISANEDLLNSAKELSSEFKETESSINGYKEKIKGLYETINDSSSSISDVTQARKDLMAVQNELIQNFGTEKDTIDIVTQAINGQADALDYLSQKKYQEWKNQFNNKTIGQAASDFFSSDNIPNALLKLTQLDFKGAGDSLTTPTDSNIDKMTDSMQHAYYEIEKSGNQALDRLIAKTYGLLDLGDKFKISGNLNNIYEDLLEIQELSNNFNVSDKFNSSLTSTANAMDETLKAYKDSYDTYILYEKILDNSKNTEYDDKFNQINKSKELYNDAVESGKEGSIKQAGVKYAETLQSAISLAMKNSDKDVAEYFKSMYPEMQQIFGEWSFELNFEPNTDGLKDKVIDALDEIDGESDGITSFSSEDILNFNPNIATQEQINAYGVLKKVADDYGLTVENLITLLEKMGLVKSENYQQLADQFGQELVNTLSDEDLQFAFSVSRGSIKTWDELIEKIKEAKEQAAKESVITSVSDVLTKLADPEAINKYNEKISTLQSYLEKLENGSFSPADESSLITDFGITGDSIDELTEKIQTLMDAEMDSIIKQIDEILNNETLDDKTKKAVENLKQSLIGTNKEAQNLNNSLSFKLTNNPLADVQSLSQGLDQLDKIYADILDKEAFDFSSILNNDQFKEQFSTYTDEYDNFINTVSKSPDDINACQDAFNKLTAAYIKGSGVLSEVTEATKAGTIAMLKQMGVSNAAAIVEQALIENEEVRKYMLIKILYFVRCMFSQNCVYSY